MSPGIHLAMTVLNSPDWEGMMKPLLSELRKRLLHVSHSTLRDRTFGNPRGATAVEYALMLTFVAAVIVLAVTSVGQTLSNMFGSVLTGFR
jgi:Flp pilus assembly pilin Flp